MPRDLSPEMLAAIASDVVRPVIFVELHFESAVSRFHSALGSILFNGEEFTGVGDLGSISSLDESVENKSYGITIQLSGIPTETLSLALGDEYQGRDAFVWLAFLDEDYNVIGYIGPYRYRMDNMTIQMGDTATVTITAEDLRVDWERPRIRRYTNADQQERFPNDKGLEFVSQTADKKIVWPKDFGNPF